MESPNIRENYLEVMPNDIQMNIKKSFATSKNINNTKPIDTHIILADYCIQVSTMNIDDSLLLARSNPIKLHGCLPNDDELDIAYTLYNKPVLYGDPAPNYQVAYDMVYILQLSNIFMVIGCSHHTTIACDLRELAKIRGAKIIEIQEDASHN